MNALEKNPRELREMAKAYRGGAEIGHTDSREWREKFAEYLERKADAIEALRPGFHS
jgi:hypothetical protein